MGTRIQNLANNFTTAGIVKAAAINDASVSGITSIPAGLGGDLTLLSTQTASASASIEFTSGIDSTYNSYVFKFINCHPSVDGARLSFNMSTDGGSNYDVVKTTTFFRTRHNEADNDAGLEYIQSVDLAQSTAIQNLSTATGNDNDQCAVGYMQLFNPSSTTYVKHFISVFTHVSPDDYSLNNYIAGYGNTTSAINAIQFKFDSGNIDDGIIKMYGVS